jgi:hypothetical protein
MITKSPSFRRAGYLKVQGSEYLDNRVEIDLTGPLAGKFAAYRLIVMNSELSGYQDNSFNKALLIDPSVTLVFGPATQLTVKGHYAKMDTAVLNLHLDPRVTVDTPVTLYPGLSPRWSGTSGSDDSNPGEEGRVTAEFTHKFSDALQMRAGAMYADLTLHDYHDQVTNGSIANRVGGINPDTGLYTPGINWTVFNYGLPTQNVVRTPVALPDFTNRSGRLEVYRSQNRDRLASARLRLRPRVRGQQGAQHHRRRFLVQLAQIHGKQRRHELRATRGHDRRA